MGFDERLPVALAGSHAVIDLDVLGANVAAMRARLEPHAELMAVVKANAYGHGLVLCARVALEHGATWLGVARIEEGLLLRAASVTAPILVLGPPNVELVCEAVEADLALAVGSVETAHAMAAQLSKRSAPARLHIKVDTGMRRYGVEPDGAVELARAIVEDDHLRLEGLFTHFATADEADERPLQEQLRRFATAYRAVQDAGLAPSLVHVANSAAALRAVAPELAPRATLVARVGLALYGLSPSRTVPVPEGFRPVMTLKSHLAHLFTLPAGEGVSYGLSYVAPRTVRCADLPIGYGDGLSRSLSNRGWVIARGEICPIRGRVCMDQTVVEVEALGDVAQGDEVVIFGDGQDGAMTADAVARLCGTINYEIVTAISARVPRVYVRDGFPVAVADLLGLVEAGEASESGRRRSARRARAGH